MSFTNLEILRKHLVSTGAPEFDIRNASVLMTGTGDISLPHMDILEDSERLKWVPTNAPSLAGPVTLTDEDAVSFGAMHALPGSVVAALDETLSTVYVDEMDYRVDYANGRIQRVAGTSIPNMQPVLVYYMPTQLFARDSDYELDYPTGIIRRIDGGAIPDGATLLLDYTVNEGSVEDSMLDQAIVEADDIVVRALSGEYSASSTDQGLQTGTTQLALSIFARARAAETLAKHRSADSHSRAREWLNLSEHWDRKAWEVLSPFLDPHMLRSPLVR